MLPTRSVALFAIALALLGSAPTTRAGSVVLLNNLDQSPQPTASSPFVGQSFISGAAEELYGARMQLYPSAPPSSKITLDVEARNANGTVGQTLFSNFSSLYDSTSGVITFTANSPFELAANTGYWLVLSDPGNGIVTWDFTSSLVYQSSFGYGLPSYNTAYYSDQNNGMGNAFYYQPSEGPQMFQLLALVPEPTSFLLLCFPVALILAVVCFQGARASRLQRPRAALATEMVRP
jgi:hypothetical protein